MTTYKCPDCDYRTTSPLSMGNHVRTCRPSDASAGYGALTGREKWLMRQAWIAAQDCYEDHNKGLDDWLNSDAADAVTVEMILAKAAPPTT